MKKILLLSFLVSNIITYGQQLGFCQGSKGDPIFTEDFGSGTGFGPQLAAGVTTYTYTPGRPNDGSYTIYNNTNGWWDWRANEDHSPNDIDGKFLIVNAAFTAGEFYSRQVNGLCANTTYEFSSWLINVSSSANGGCGGGTPHIPINIKFEIWDETNTNRLAWGDTGNISAMDLPTWNQYGLTFTTGTGQDTIILKMINNGNGGCGNDLGIDDIVFRSCGDLTTISSIENGIDDYSICEDQTPLNINLTAAPELSVYSAPVYQWQISNDGSSWTDINFATNSTYNASNILVDTYYRVKVAENNSNLSNNNCNSASAPYKIDIIEVPNPPNNTNNVTVCSKDVIPTLTVTVEASYTANWYDAQMGGSLLKENSITYETNTAGTYWVEATHPLASCTSTIRTPVTLTINKTPEVVDENLKFCQNQPFTISAGIDNVTYAWNTGAITKEIPISTPGIYTVTVTSPEICSAIKTITTSYYDTPIIKSITSNKLDIIVSTEEKGDFEYSLDNIIYQASNIFKEIRGGEYTIYVRNKNGCNPVFQEYIHLEIPFFFTPNGDGTNDILVFYGLENFISSTVSIFNRYGKLLVSESGATFLWDGSFNGLPLPSADYWYQITLDNGKKLKGHFSLKR